MTKSLDEILEHSGILGMKWGKRKSKSSVSKSSSDHLAVQNLRKKKIDELSNEDLRKLTTRLQLEKQLKDLSPDKVTSGKKKLDKLLSFANTANTIVSTINSPLGKAIISGVKNIK